MKKPKTIKIRNIKKKKLDLSFVWNIRLNLYAEANKLYMRYKELDKEETDFRIKQIQKGSEAYHLEKKPPYGNTQLINKREAEFCETGCWEKVNTVSAKGNMLWAESSELEGMEEVVKAERYLLRAKGRLLKGKADKIWAEAVLAVYGNIKIRWKGIEGEDSKNLKCMLETGVEEFNPRKEK